jgi:hypothetical protein
MDVTKHQTGMFSWADLGTPDLEGSKQFYKTLLELDSMDMPMGEGMGYSLMQKRGRNVFAAYTMPAEMKQMTGGQPVWQSYFTIENADEIVPRITELGGVVAQEPVDVMDAGRLVVAQDPTGATFAVWEPRAQIGAEVFGEPGALSWCELYTRDTAAAADFYTGLFGWTVEQTQSGDGGEYNLFSLGEQPAAGMMAIREEWGPMPPHWSIYLSVADLDASLAKLQELGGQQISPAMAVEGVGRFAFICDPQGAYSTIIERAPRDH